jgi:hypothetical protein
MLLPGKVWIAARGEAKCRPKFAKTLFFPLGNFIRAQSRDDTQSPDSVLDDEEGYVD